MSYDDAAACIRNSCRGFNNCLAMYTRDFPTGGRLASLTNDAQGAASSSRCKPPPPQSVDQIVSNFGLVGVWARDCNQSPSGNNVHTGYSVSQNGGGKVNVFRGTSQTDFVIRRADRIDNGKLALKLQDQAQGTGQDVVLLSENGRYRVWSSKPQNGPGVGRERYHFERSAVNLANTLRLIAASAKARRRC
jgi:hypothetical protein